MLRQELYRMVREKATALLGGYVQASEIVPPQLGARAGVLGAIALAQAVLAEGPPAYSQR
jgi:hypothetical protein